MSENIILLKQNGKTKKANLDIEEYMKNKSSHLCTECIKYMPGVCPTVSVPTTEHISKFPIITGGCQVYYDNNLSIIMYIDGCLRYKKTIRKNEKDNIYKCKKNDERIAKGAAVFSEKEEEEIRSVYRHHDWNNIPDVTVDYAKIRSNYKSRNKSR